jgi:nucleoside-diphosphate kinase
MSNESTLVLIKPDGVNRGLIGKVIDRLESTGLKIVGMKLILIDKDLASNHYEEHKDKPFFSSLVDFITASPVVALALNGENAIQKTRTMMGITNPLESAPGTIRGDFGLTVEKNIIHGSANEKDAKREIDLYFSNNELIDYSRSIDEWTE